MRLVSAKDDNIHLLKLFIENIGSASKTFRYFEKRPAAVINNHLVALLILELETPVAYGHLESEGDKIWLGICVLPKYTGKGFGNLMMENLIESARKQNIQIIDLTVDKLNLSAIKLYEKFNFKKSNEGDSYYRYQLIL